MRRNNPERRFRRRALAISVGLAFASAAAPAGANPTGATVVSGGASFSASGNTLNITNTPGAIINWQQFSIAKDEITRFIQQNAASAVLNRVVGQNPTAILGQLLSNGRVFLINPSGIAFGQGAIIDVAGLAASTLNISDADFLSGRLRFVGTGAEGKVTNAGTIRTPAGGSVYLIAPNVENQASGVITSPKGEVVIAAGNSVELVNAGTPDIRVEFSAPANEAVNAGQVVASSGNLGIYGTLIRNSGLVSASRAEAGDGGKIVFKAAGDSLVEGAGRVEATGEHGGSIQLLGNRVGLTDSASVDASGDLGGGTVLVGGDAHGANANVQNAWRTYVGPNATIKADALASGDGGKVVVWSDDVTRFYGSLSAHAGTSGGNGGFAEVSGKQTLAYDGNADLSAPSGSLGTLLFDPYDITVGTSSLTNTSVMFADFGSNTSITLTNTSLNTASANVVLEAQHDVNINAAVSLKNDVSFIAQAGHDVVINAPLITNGLSTDHGRIHLEADSPHPVTSPSWFDGAGAVRINALVSSCGGSGALSNCRDGYHNGGNITLIAGGNTNGNSPSSGGFDLGSDVIAGGGGINVSLADATGSSTLPFKIGSSGVQLSSSDISGDTGQLKTAGPLVLGQALSAGDRGLADPLLGAGASNDNAILLTVGSITNHTATPIVLSPDAGSSFELIASDPKGGITLDKALTTSQNTIISTPGTLTVNATLSTSGNLTINAGSLVIGSSGSLNYGGTCSGCPSKTTHWTDALGTHNWFDAGNWDNGLPDANTDASIGSGYSTISIATGATASAKSLNALSPVQISSGSLTLSNASTFSNTLSIISTGALQSADVLVSGSTLTWSGGSLSGNIGTFLLGSDANGTLSNSLTLNRAFQNSGSILFSSATLNGSGTFTNLGTINSTSTLTLAGATLDLGTSATTLAKLALNSGAVTGTGNFTVSDFTRSGTFQDGGSFGTGFASVDLTHVGDFAVPGYTASNTVGLHSSGGRLALNGAVSASGSGDAIVLSGSNFTNNAGFGALSTPSGRWLVYSTNPGSDSFGGLASLNKAIWSRSYPTSVPETGNRYVFSDVGAVTVATTDANKTYGSLPIDLSSTYTLSGYPVEAATFGNVYANAAVSDIFATGPSITSVGNTGTASVGGGTGTGGAYPIASLGTANTGYSLIFANTGLLSINPAALSITANDASKTYGQVLNFNGSEFTSSGLQNRETIGGITLTSAGAASTAGVATSPYAIVPSAATGGSFSASNYAITYNNGALTVNPAVIRLAGSRVYDGTTNFPASAFGTNGAISTGINGETLTVNGTGTVASPNVSAGTQALALGSLALGNGTGLASNYTLTGGAYTGTITAAPLSLAGTRVYDGTTSLTASAFGTNGTIGTGINGETLTLGGTGSVGSKNIGTHSLSLDTLSLADGTGSASNYTLAGGAHIGTITARSLMVSATAQNKVYDGKTSASATLSDNRVAGDALTLAYTAADFDTKDVGTAKPVSVSGISVTGTDAGNYSFNATASTNADITQKVVNLAGTRVYDGTSNFTVGSFTPTISGTVGSETLTLASGGGVGSVASKNVGSGPLTTGTIALADGTNGGLASNYTLVGGTHTGAITTRAITVAPQSGQSKIYGEDDPVTAKTAYQLTSGSLVGTDSLTGDLGRAVGENVGSYAFTQRTVAVNDGNGGANYSLAFDGTANNFQITQRTVYGSIPNQTKTYGFDDPAPSSISVILSGLVKRSVLDINGNSRLIDDTGNATATLTGLSRAPGEDVNSYAISVGDLGGNLGNNYYGPIFTGSPKLTITPAPALTGTIADQAKTYGTSDPAIAGIGVSLSGLVKRTVSTWNGNVAVDDSSSVTTSVASLSRTPGENVGSYAITGGTLNPLSGPCAPNYSGVSFSTSGNTLSITPAMITYTADPATRQTGQPNPLFTGNYSGALTATVTDWNGNTTTINDTSALSGTLAFTTTATISSPAGQYPIVGSGLGSANYAFVPAPSNATALTIVTQSFTDSLLNPVIHTILTAPETQLPTTRSNNEEKKRSVGAQSCK